MDCSEIIKIIKASIAFIAVLDTNNKLIGTGSGFIFSKKGILVTCNHVVKGSATIVLKFPDSTEFISAKVIMRDDEHDLALLKFDDQNRKPLEVGNLDNVIEGMRVIFSGYPFGAQDLTTHQGIISAIIKDATDITSYLIDGTVNSGNSGCPLLNSEGKVIGIVNAKRRNRNDLLSKVEELQSGAIALHGIDLVEIYQALSNNLQLGVGIAVPASYIPEHKELKEPIALKKEEKKK